VRVCVCMCACVYAQVGKRPIFPRVASSLHPSQAMKGYALIDVVRYLCRRRLVVVSVAQFTQQTSGRGARNVFA
jgi:hypothetical protein